MSVLRSLLTAGVLASGLLWSLNGITATPAAQASGDRYEVTSSVTRMPPVWTVISQIPKVCMANMLPLSTRITNCPVTCTNCHGQPSPQHREG
ncbi:cytochrome c nitrite reductase pentaheme subunit [Escherichia coli]|uniref:Cytochrome c nitrite reductase pentaheme subunit n=1 Tax=Escherichia coli TaxID=562 RepID=A0A377E9F6_ECOLX|nr:cytochrome c nitrite reductase pentaheme subunit [Escherichia coli]